jgi:hypothetical protein
MTIRNLTIELLPAARGLASCSMTCRHCFTSKAKAVSTAPAFYSPESVEAVNRVLKFGREQGYHLGLNLSAKGVASENMPAIHTPMDVLSIGMDAAEHGGMSALVPEFAARARRMVDVGGDWRNTILRFPFKPERDENFQIVDPEGFFSLIRSAAIAHLLGEMGDVAHQICILPGINDANMPEQDDDLHMMHRYETSIYQLLLSRALKDTPYECVELHDESELGIRAKLFNSRVHGLYAKKTEEFTSFVITLHGRYMTRTSSPKNAPTSLQEGDFSVMHLPDGVWLFHDTRHTEDQTVRFSYPEWHAILDAAEADVSRPLWQRAADAVMARR